MVKSKAWDWNNLNHETRRELWLEPSIESYYLVNRWKTQKKKSFLDLGCGIGRHTIQFAKAGFKTTAEDLSVEALRQTKEWADEENLFINVKYADMLDLPFANNCFDCILCRNVISHTDTQGIIKIIDRIYDMLKADGECFLTLGSKNASTFNDLKNEYIDENTRARMDEGPEKGIPHFYADMDIIPELFKNFEIIDLYQTQEFHKDENGNYISFWHYNLLIKKI